MPKRYEKTLAGRFPYTTEPETGCWVWDAGKDRDGYGKLRVDGRNDSAHREAYRRWKGPIPDGLYVCHACDNPSCVNPAHLWVGTNSENQRDSVRKGRSAGQTGSANAYAKLTESDVVAIRSDTRTQAVIATDFGITRSHVSYIRNRRSW